MFVLANNGLKLSFIDAFLRSNDPQALVFRLIFWDCLLDRSVVLLIAREDMGH